MSLSELEILSAARRITGNKFDAAVTERYVPDDDVLEEMRESIQELNAIAGSTSGRKEFQFSTVANQQLYVISTTIGADVDRILEVYRGSANYGDYAFSDIHPSTGLLTGYSSGSELIPAGFQEGAMETIAALRRFAWYDRYEWEDVENPIGGLGRSLRLIPTPSGVEKIHVVYVATTSTVGTLPDRARNAAVYAACVAIFECVLNRVNTQDAWVKLHPDIRRDQILFVERRLSHYIEKYERAKLKLGSGT